MIIRKRFSYESSHRVLEAFTKRCKENIHGHSYILEMFLSSCVLDQAEMVVDFTLLKDYFGPFIDSFDHSHLLWDIVGNEEECDYITKHNNRWVMLPFNSTAEKQAQMFFTFGVNAIKLLTSKDNILPCVKMSAARVHETATGYAEYGCSDGLCHNYLCLNDIVFSPGIISDWSPKFVAFYKELLEHEKYDGGTVAQSVLVSK